jgi:hypothetical protein
VQFARGGLLSLAHRGRLVRESLISARSYHCAEFSCKQRTVFLAHIGRASYPALVALAGPNRRDAWLNYVLGNTPASSERPQRRLSSN